VTGAEVAELLLDLAEGDLAARRSAVARLAACGEPAVPDLVRFMAEDSDSDARWYAASALALIGAPSIGPLVAAIEENTDVQFRRYAAAALGHIGEPAVRPSLQPSRQKTRWHAVFCAGPVPGRQGRGPASPGGARVRRPGDAPVCSAHTLADGRRGDRAPPLWS